MRKPIAKRQWRRCNVLAEPNVGNGTDVTVPVTNLLWRLRLRRCTSAVVPICAPTTPGICFQAGSRPADGFSPAASLNPCELEIDLFCKGMRIDESCLLEKDGRPILRTRAGLGSGLELVIPGPLKDVWVNVPVREAFAARSCYRLAQADGQYEITDDRQGFCYAVRIPREPSWYGRRTSGGVPMHQIGVLQGTYLGIYISNSCGFWHHSPRMNCGFCTTGLNVGVNEVALKEVQDVVEVAQAAKRESSVTFVHFNSGYQTNHDLDRAAPYVRAVKSQVGALVGLQLMPTRDLEKYDRLIELGTDHFSFCYEFHNPEYFKKFCPGKARFVGQETYYRALEYTSRQLGKGTCSGEIIAGLEPVDDTLKAIDYITSVGAFPTVCVFRPTTGSDLENWPPPRYEDMRIVFQHVYQACRKNGIPMDVAPNIEVSLVVQPGDTRYLAPRALGSRSYNLRQAALKVAARPYFWWKRHRRAVRGLD